MLQYTILFCLIAQASNESYQKKADQAYSLIVKGKFAEAEVVQREAVAIAKQSGESSEQVDSLSILAWTIYRLGRPVEAESHGEEALRISKKIHTKNDVKMLSCLSILGTIKQSLHKDTEAFAMLVKSLEICELHYGQASPKTASRLLLLARFYRQRLGKLEDSEILTRKAIEIFKEIDQKGNIDEINALDDLANILVDKRQFVEAEQLKKNALGQYERMNGKEHPVVASTLSSLADIQVDQNKIEEAENNCVRALAIQEKAFGRMSLEVGDSLVVLSRVKNAQHDYEACESSLRRSLTIYKRYLPNPHTKQRDVLLRLSLVLHQQSHTDEAKEIDKSIKEMENMIEQQYMELQKADP